ncbi:hypothetical protein EI42_03889 [Thermosporothrix hazakensis]|uniref:Uncharacterized protein n=1 Tax=Thermosporothrix hazakensis TaxID=644383 RepID=A0A326U320_THEHA|nr:hypothetical protein EI42_03889 [Thermosporothrix hazakensis]
MRTSPAVAGECALLPPVLFCLPLRTLISGTEPAFVLKRATVTECFWLNSKGVKA